MRKFFYYKYNDAELSVTLNEFVFDGDMFVNRDYEAVYNQNGEVSIIAKNMVMKEKPTNEQVMEENIRFLKNLIKQRDEANSSMLRRIKSYTRRINKLARKLLEKGRGV